MADEKEELLQKEIADYEEKLRVLASKLQELAGVDCNFGSCVFDPEMKTVEEKLADLQRRKKTLQEIMESLKQCKAQ